MYHGIGYRKKRQRTPCMIFLYLYLFLLYDPLIKSRKVMICFVPTYAHLPHLFLSYSAQDSEQYFFPFHLQNNQSDNKHLQYSQVSSYDAILLFISFAPL